MFSVGWIGYGGNQFAAEALREDLCLMDIELKTCHEYPNATVPYSYTTVHDFIDSCDVMILPARVKIQPAKSVNRLALCMSRRKACVIAPLESYLRYAKHGENCLVAENNFMFIKCIQDLVDDPVLRQKIADNAHYTAARSLHPSQHVTKFFNELRKVGLTNPWSADTFVQIIIPHYAPRTDYLELAVKSALESWGPQREVLVVSSSKVDPATMLESIRSTHLSKGEIRYHHQEERLNFAEANNVGLGMLDPKTTHILLLNDDTIMGHRALGGMIERIGDHLMILNPYSNCDKGWLHNDDIYLGPALAGANTLDLHPNMTIEEFTKTDLKEVRLLDFYASGENSDSSLNPTTFCAMFCTMIPKGVFDRVGLLSTLFQSGGEDYDYSQRAARMGMNSYWTKDAFVFHFGGKTRKVAEAENPNSYHEEDRHNNLLIRKRWPENKKRVAIWTGGAFERWDLNSYKEIGIGGSETCAGRLAQTIAKEGHSVTLYGDHEYVEQDGVQLVPWNDFKPSEEYFDLFIASRNINCITEQLRAKRIVAWIHDVFLMSGQYISDYHRNRIDKFIVLSPWHKEFVKSHHTLEDKDLDIIPNGVNVELFDEYNPESKQFGKLLWTSSPDRGLDNLLYLLPWIKEKVPETHVDVTYGFYNWVSAARQRNNLDELKRIEKLKKQIDEAEYATLHGRLNQPELAKLWAKTYLWLYPTNFSETFCLSAKEAQVSGTPIICSSLAGLETTVGQYGHLVKHHAYSQEGREEFVLKAVEVLSNRKLWAEMSAQSRAGSSDMSWAARWHHYWRRWLD